MPTILPSDKVTLRELIKKVNDDRLPITVVNENGQDAVIMSSEDFDSMKETIYLLTSKVNAEWLYDSITELKDGKLISFTMEELKKYEDEH